ncbi:solute carrier family 26 member 10 isoform X2 [Orussus abietinus]|uniref:solute carrier family 26 member 10 isoform X2 n=1 Tax=Orussus abietinus TaxID=222816 RepID=UPI000625E3ED|nr:solute carrier family 26 member 10 isoform X2 [Orussus abietinus]XP_023289691.1 solute carrier family 26 member 10 isoform X2 [Orussus abietinus]
MAAVGPEVIVRRPVYQQEEFHRIYEYVSLKKNLGLTISKKGRKCQLDSCFRRTVPFAGWIREYDWRNKFFCDLVAGVTVAVMHIPQGMAYAILGNVPPIVGIYMAFFPVLVYMFLGTSRHNSMGTFALVCMMTGKTVLTHSSGHEINSTVVSSMDNVTGQDMTPSQHFSPTEIATAVTFTVALMQMAMYVLRLGVISSLLSETLISGFTTAAAVHVLTSQVKDLLGLSLKKRMGIFKVVFTYVDIVNAIDNVNVTAVVVSGITIILLVFNNEILKPRISKMCPFPVPIEMIAVIASTLFSVYMNLPGNYNIVTVGHIPVGLPEPRVPPMSLISDVLLDSFVITMVSYTISMSMALIFAQKMNYEVDANQELLAQGAGNLVGSFFSCMPFTASLSRSMVQQTVGGYSQLASFVSCGILLCVLLWVGPFFEPLPRCVLASIIVVALKGMLLQVKQLPKFWKLSRVDALVWLVTFSTVILLDIEYGLLIGVLTSLTSLIVYSSRPYACRLALVPGTEIYLEAERYKGTVDVPGVRILRYCGSLNFASKTHFRKEVYKTMGFNALTELENRRKTHMKETSSAKIQVEGYTNPSYEEDRRSERESSSGNYEDEEKREVKDASPNSIMHVLVLDFSALTYIDPTGCATVRSLAEEYKKTETVIFLAGSSGPVFETMRKCMASVREKGLLATFPTVGDAVNFARHEFASTLTPIWTGCGRYEEGTCMSRFGSREPEEGPLERSGTSLENSNWVRTLTGPRAIGYGAI